MQMMCAEASSSCRYDSETFATVPGQEPNSYRRKGEKGASC
jgi:hypothetical protein